jgi:lipoteichoic acid synthase
MIAFLALAGLAVKALGVGLAIVPQAPANLIAPVASTLSLTFLIGAALCLIPAHRRTQPALLLNVVCSVILLGDIWHARYYGDALSIGRVELIGQLQVVPTSVMALPRMADLAIVADLALLIPWAWVMRAGPQSARPRWTRPLAMYLVCASVSASALLSVRAKLDEVFEYQYSFEDVAGTLGLAGYHVLDLTTALVQAAVKHLTVTQEEVDQLQTWFEQERASRIASPLAGAAQGRNVILMSAESLPDFALGLSIDGQPVAPNFTAFAAESLRFTDYYEQTHRNTTTSAEFMALNSMLPTQGHPVSTHYQNNTFYALPHVLRAHGYATFSACGEPPTFWNMRQIHQRYGIEQSLFLPDLRMTEWIGAGLADDAFLAQAADAVERLPEPFFAFLLTSSNHHPWQIPEARRLLRPEPLPGTIAGGYLQSIRFADAAFGTFIQTLRQTGLLDRSLVVVYGDHRAWLDQGNLERLWAVTGHERPLSPFELWQFERRVPLMIRLPHGANAGPRDVPGGHIDIAPTVTSLLGLDDVDAPWIGRDLTAPAQRSVMFREGEVTTGQATALRVGGRTTCFARDGSTIPCDDLMRHVEEGRARFARSDRIIAADLVRALADRLGASARPAPVRLERVLAIAHRGNSLHLPENTAEAIRSAFDIGADLVEIDVRLSRDGVPIVFHDDTLERTTTARGVPEALTFREFMALDVGAWKGPRFRGTPPLSFADALTVARGRGRLYLDIKDAGLAGPIADVLRRLGIGVENVLVGVGTTQEVAEFHRHMPGVDVVRLIDTPTTWPADLFTRFKQEGLWGIELGDDWPASLVGEAVAHDMPVLAYTVNDEATMARLVERGIRGIETDDPALLVGVLKRLGVR